MKLFIAILEPKTYSSPSGSYTLFVDPTNRWGSGGAQYQLKHKGAVVWQGMRPFTLWHAAVSDTGVVGGYAYSGGIYGFVQAPAGRHSFGDLAILILDERGRERLHRKVTRVSGHYEDQSPQPEAVGVLIDGTQQKLVVRVPDPNINIRAEKWWVFDLATGRTIGNLTPKGGAAFDPAQDIVAVCAVNGTPLILTQWWYSSEKNDSVGARFTLIDLGDRSARPIWTLDLPRDYNVPGNGPAELALGDEIRESGAILAGDVDRHFTLRFATRKQRVTFQVTAEPQGTWQVRQIDIARYVAPSPPAEPHVPETTLRLRDRIDLITASASTSPGRDAVQSPHGVVAMDAGRLAFLRNVDPVALVVVAPNGEILHDVKLCGLAGMPAKSDGLSAEIVWQGETHFLVFFERQDRNGSGKNTEAYRFDVQTRVGSPLHGFTSFSIRALAAFPGDGQGFVTLTNADADVNAGDCISAYDADGRVRWTRRTPQGYTGKESPDTLFSPEAVAVLRDGTVAVLDNVKNTVQLFDSTGRYLRTIDAQSAWKRTPSYLSAIGADASGGMVIQDFDGIPAFVRLSRDGVIRSQFSPRYKNGEKIANPGFCVDSGDNVWVNDHFSLIGLDANGRAIRRIGTPPSVQKITSIAAIAVQSDGPSGHRILVCDDRTAAVHVLDASGRLVHICIRRKGVAEAESPSGDWSNVRIDSAPDYSFGFDGDWFSGNGQRCAKPAGLRTATDRLEKLERRANGYWLGSCDQIEIAGDGSIAIADSDIRAERSAPYVTTYSRSNQPLMTFRAPTALGNLPRLAFDGGHIILAGNDWVYCFDRSGKPRWRFRPAVGRGPALDDAPLWQPFLIDRGRTLCLFDGKRTLNRYDMR